MHLVSTFRYPTIPRLEINEVTKWLVSAPKVARDTAPFIWTILECPPDGTIYLTWQPTARRGAEFASDGYVWGGPETYYRNDVGNGLVWTSCPYSYPAADVERMLTIGADTRDLRSAMWLPDRGGVCNALAETLPTCTSPADDGKHATGRPQSVDYSLRSCGKE